MTNRKNAVKLIIYDQPAHEILAHSDMFKIINNRIAIINIKNGFIFIEKEAIPLEIRYNDGYFQDDESVMIIEPKIGSKKFSAHGELKKSDFSCEGVHVEYDVNHIILELLTSLSFNLLNTDGSCVLTERKTKNKKLLSLAFSYFQSVVYMCIYQHHDVYERFRIRSFVFKHMFIDAIEREKSFFRCVVLSEDSGIQDVN